jgi:hypothetical protein
LLAHPGAALQEVWVAGRRALSAAGLSEKLLRG